MNSITLYGIVQYMGEKKPSVEMTEWRKGQKYPPDPSRPRGILFAFWTACPKIHAKRMLEKGAS